jgi:hypothetical protein
MENNQLIKEIEHNVVSILELLLNQEFDHLDVVIVVGWIDALYFQAIQRRLNDATQYLHISQAPQQHSTEHKHVIKHSIMIQHKEVSSNKRK